MFKYTLVPGGDEIVEKDLRTLQQAIEGKKYDSLLLFGSFAKGEGLVLHGKPRNDYDLMLLGGNEETEKALLEADINTEVDVFSVDAVPSVCTQQMFEMAYAHEVIAGNKVPFPKWQPYEIPYVDAIESLGKRSASLMLAKYEMGKDDPDYRKVAEQIDKAIIAIGDAILIKRGQFHPRYTTRAIMLGSDEIGGLYTMAVQNKITGFPEHSPDRLWELWFAVRDEMRMYVVQNKIKNDKTEVVVQYSEAITQDQLVKILPLMGVDKKWL